jgi:F0F1-type ATP synthase membrane subunit c/vacuolar-type H+-ATPase subunit K
MLLGNTAIAVAILIGAGALGTAIGFGLLVVASSKVLPVSRK